MSNLEYKNLKKQYEKRLPKYRELGNIIKDELGKLLTQNEIEFDLIQMRIKSFDSFFEKIFRNDIKDPFKEIEDFCGLRIVHLFENDLDKIKKIVKSTFKKVKEVDKTFQSKDPKRNKEREFSYRSYHIIVSLEGESLKSKTLNEYVAEIQIRTMCMHAWAAIEHKLNYKQQDDVPKSFRPIITRKFSQMSAMLEIADEHFVSLRKQKDKVKNKYIKDLSQPNTKEKVLEELNIDILQVYLEKKFPKYNQESNRLKYLLEEMQTTNITLKDIERGETLLLKNSLFESLIENYPTDSKQPTQTGIARLILDTTNKRFYELRKNKVVIRKWMRFVASVRAKLKLI